MEICPYCGTLGYFYFSISSRSYFRCHQCDLIYVSMQISKKTVTTPYPESYFERYADDQTKGHRNNVFNHVLELIEKRNETGALLDVGTGCGNFLAAAKKRGWMVKGVEPCPSSVFYARMINGLDVVLGTLDKYEHHHFDVITFINVLDHSATPWEEVTRANSLLRPGGLLYLRFPNALLHTSAYRIAQNYGLAKTVNRYLVFHRYSFTATYIRRLLYDKGYYNIQIMNSPLSQKDPHQLFPSPRIATFTKKAIVLFVNTIEFLSYGTKLLGPSLEVIANKPKF